MLKVVGASWLQTRISTYILVAVALLGIGAIILGEYGHVENDGTYSATVSWNHKGGYRIDFWGQGNDLASVKLNVARAYYKTSILESGWSIIEIETSSKYPDTVQAYAAGLLEGSLTWQLIHHHWYNTVNVICEKQADKCQKLMRFLRGNTAIVRERAELLGATDPFWHMVRLFYIQLDGLEAGWRFAVRRSRQTVEMDSGHFLWLAMAADLPDLELAPNVTDHTKGMICLKNLPRNGLEPLIAIGHTTAAPYAKMLRLLKKYTFGYHVLPMLKSAAPGRSVMMSSYPGALSSHDEFYLIQGHNRELIVAKIPLAVINHHWNLTKMKDQVMSSAKTMAANRLATNGRVWSRILLLQNGSEGARQWITLEPHNRVVMLVEQLSGIARVADISEQFAATGALCRTGNARLRDVKVAIDDNDEEGNGESNDDITRGELVARLQKNITTVESFRRLMRGYSHEDTATATETAAIITTTATINEDEDRAGRILAYRGDLEDNGSASPFGVIDAKIVLADVNGVKSFEAASGPSTLGGARKPFRWSKAFPNVSHVGQPDVFKFGNVVPLWVWI
ncbi:PREDICTED: putative phospholipase B-like lamina ancestor [Dinoponera quadriceps]|uniref:Phospholipase B-like n=1 Tax=Dinoponera quadriceps TaxID=609295 RepID=A0A6P3X3D5_DINQU|nr:PREDICTED: putative phospholipase B-like lamina ancestor [Dinoponera quadriceps]XP_014472866.1 PREDICTED: putative phospholipase B-like lamina ancestor [Dinoponera quadriceps]